MANRRTGTTRMGARAHTQALTQARARAHRAQEAMKRIDKYRLTSRKMHVRV